MNARFRAAPPPLAAVALLAIAALPVPLQAKSCVGQLEVHDRSSNATLPVHRKFGKRWISGEPGHEYAVRVRNCSPARVLAVISVDGVNVITGATASPAQSGYVIEPGEVVYVEGWRKSLEQTAAFVFTDPSNSYAARTGRADDLGVIGVALFRERQVLPQTFGNLEARQGAVSAIPPAAAPAEAEAKASADTTRRSPSLGTGHGRKEHSPAQWTQFDRASDRPDETISIRYETQTTLVALGVLPRTRWPDRDPSPFPAALGFVPDP